MTKTFSIRVEKCGGVIKDGHTVRSNTTPSHHLRKSLWFVGDSEKVKSFRHLRVCLWCCQMWRLQRNILEKALTSLATGRYKNANLLKQRLCICLVVSSWGLHHSFNCHLALNWFQQMKTGKHSHMKYWTCRYLYVWHSNEQLLGFLLLGL